MSEDASLSSGADQPSVFGTPTQVPVTPDTPLDLDELLTQGRLVERTMRICIRGDLYAEHQDAVEELAQLVDFEGNLLEDGDQALADTSRAQELSQRIQALADQMRAASRTVRFQAMPSADYQVFAREHLGPDGKPKDEDAWNEQIISRCAIEPRMTVAQVRQIAQKLGPAQFIALANTAFYACTIGGLDVPKSPAFSRTLQRQASGRS